ncbi:hypothetical protein [Streptomyces sp. NPDC048643]|uniref:hypothetical protein n=1 Tax=Streptomyces sp. NPDC048643 TaxID=3155637 RepID=UPI003419204A
MKSFRAAAIALAAASIAFGGVIGTAQVSPATPAHTAATDGNTDGDSGWGGRVINVPTDAGTTRHLTAGDHTTA